MGRIISIVFAIFAVTFTTAAQAKPGLPSFSELLVVDCGKGGENCPASDGRTIQGVIDERKLDTTPEKVALLTDTRTGECPNLVSGAVWMICELSNGSKMWVDPLDYQLRTAAQARALDQKLDCRRVEFGLNRRHGAQLVVFQQLPPCQRGREACEAYVAGLEKKVRDPGAARPSAQSAPGQSPPSDDEFSALQAALSQESRAFTALRNAVADCDGKVQLGEDGKPICVAAYGGLSRSEVVYAAMVAVIFGLAFWWLWRERERIRAAWKEALESLRLAQDAHNALHTLHHALRVQVDRAKVLLNANDDETVDASAEATRRGVLAGLGVDYREVPRDADIVQAVSDKVATLKDRYHELAAQIRRTRGVLRVADDVDLAQAAQTRMDELKTLREERDRISGRLLEVNGDRAALASKVEDALGELGVPKADADEIALHARRATEKINHLGAELAYAQRASEQAQEERDRAAEEAKQATVRASELEQRAAEARANAEVSSALASRTQAELSGLRGRVNGFAGVTEKIAASLDGAEYFYAHPYARPRRKQGGQMVDSPRRERFGQLITTLRGVFPAQPTEPKPPRSTRGRGKRAAGEQAAAPA